MFGTTHRGASAYAAVNFESSISSASPHRLIVMLFDGAIVSVVAARQYMKSGNIPAKGQNISKAISILENGLRASLDKKVGGEIAQSLDSLYEYMRDRLVIANLKNQPEILDEVHRLLVDLKNSWEAIGTPANSPSAPTATEYDAVPPVSVYYSKA